MNSSCSFNATIQSLPQARNLIGQKDTEDESLIPKRSKLFHDPLLSSQVASNYQETLESDIIDLETFEKERQPVFAALETREEMRQSQSKMINQDSISSLKYAPQIRNMSFNSRKGFFSRKPRGIMMHPNRNHPLSNILTTSSLDGAIQFTDITT